MENSPVIHIGLPKTASTTLQKYYFDNHSELYYLGSALKGESQPEAAHNFFRQINSYPSASTPQVQLKNHFYAALLNDPLIKKAFQKRYNPQKNLTAFNKLLNQEKKKVIISSEGLSVGILVPPKEKAERLRTYCPEAKIVLVIRNPLNWIKSRYLQFYRGLGGKIEYVPDISVWLEHNLRERESFQSVFQDLHWGVLLNKYASIYGPKNIHVLLFEEFVNNRQEFIQKFSKILNVDLSEVENREIDILQNPSMTDGDLHYNSLLKYPFFRNSGKPIHKISRKIFRSFFNKKPIITIDKKYRNKIVEIFNRQVPEIKKYTSLSLSDYGYPVEN